MRLLKLTYIQYFFYTLLSLIAFGFIVKTSKIVLAPLILAIIISVALYPLLNNIQKKINSRFWSVTLLISLLSLFIGSLFYIMAIQFSNFYDDYPDISEKIMVLINQLEDIIQSTFGLTNFNIIEEVKENGDEILKSSTKTSPVSSFLKNISGLVTYIVLIPIYIFLMLYYKSAIKRFIQMLFELMRIKASRVINEISILVQNYLKGIFTVILILGTVNSVGLFLLGVPYAFILGFMVAFFEIIPYIGILFGSTIVLFISYLDQGEPLTLLYIVILFSIVQFIEGNFLTPKIVGNRVNLNPLIAIIALLIGEQIWGVVGMIIALPRASIMIMIMKHMKSNAFYQIEKKPTEEKN